MQFKLYDNWSSQLNIQPYRFNLQNLTFKLALHVLAPLTFFHTHPEIQIGFVFLSVHKKSADRYIDQHSWVVLRRRRDSNPRYPLEYAGFQDRCIKPALPLLRLSDHRFGL